MFPFHSHLSRCVLDFPEIFSSCLTIINYSFLMGWKHLLSCVYHTVQNSIGTLHAKVHPFTGSAASSGHRLDLLKKRSAEDYKPLFFLFLFLSHDQYQVCILKSTFSCSLFLTLRDEIIPFDKNSFIYFFSRLFGL